MATPRLPRTPANAAVAALLLAAVTLVGCGGSVAGGNYVANPATLRNHTIVFVWDGLRPDSIDKTNTPNLSALAASGTYFSDNHSTYPTYTMANAASFATGGFIGTTGFNGNNTYAAGAKGNSSAGTAVDFSQPIFTEDYGILDDLNTYYQANYTQSLLTVGTLFSTAQAAGFTTAAVGKSGPAYLQDFGRGGLIADERVVFPLSFAQELQAKGFALPNTTPFGYASGVINLAANNGSPTLYGATAKLADGATSDPTSTVGSREAADNQYLANVFTQDILANHLPDLSLIWLRNPDATEHDYGPGTPNYNNALQAQDAVLGQIMAQLTASNQLSRTNIIVVSDHAHSSVSGPQTLFPLHALQPMGNGTNSALGPVSPNGYSVSGFVRGADLLTRAGFHAFDGVGCVLEPVLSGVTAAGTNVYPTQTDATGSVCGKAGTQYTTPSYVVPAALPSDAVIVVTPGGSEMYFVPSHNPAVVQKLVTFLQSREEYGPIFVDGRYGALNGTFPASAARLQNASQRNPDVIVSMNYDETQTVQGKLGTTFNNSANNRGMHGSFSPIDVHNTLIMSGPDYKAGFTDTLPSGNVDVAPTVAMTLGMTLPKADGRPLLEALKSVTTTPTYGVTPGTVAAPSATGLQFQLPTDPTGKTLDTALAGTYNATIHTKVLLDPTTGKSYTYYDYVKTTRQ